MNWIANNWYLVVALIVILAFIIACVIKFASLPAPDKIENLKAWLCYAVVQAEKELGAKTGQLKLHMVYDMAVERFPWIVDYIPFGVFSLWVDEALEWMRNQLGSNEAAANYVKGE